MGHLALIAQDADELAAQVDALAARMLSVLDGAELRDVERARCLLRYAAARARIRVSGRHRQNAQNGRRNVAERPPVVSAVPTAADTNEREQDALRSCFRCSARFAAERSACPLCGFTHVHGLNDVAPESLAHAEAGRISAVCGGGSA